MSNIVLDKIAYDLLLKIRKTNKYSIENQYRNEIKDGKEGYYLKYLENEDLIEILESAEIKIDMQ